MDIYRFLYNYSQYDLNIVKKGIVNTAQCYQAYGRYNYRKNLPPMKADALYQDTNNKRIYRFGIIYRKQIVPYIIVQIYEISTYPTNYRIYHDAGKEWPYDYQLKSDHPMKIISLKLSDAMHLAKWQKGEYG